MSEKEIIEAERVETHMFLLLAGPPRNHEEAVQHGNAMAATGDYPVGTTDCFNVGISGGCGPDCFAYLEGNCEEPDEMLPRLENEDEIKRHRELYGSAENQGEARVVELDAAMFSQPKRR